MKHVYLVDGNEFEISTQPGSDFFYGESEVLSERFGDLTSQQPWFDDGYQVVKSDDFYDHKNVKDEIQNTLRAIIQEANPEIDLHGFTLETYHEYVNDSDHLEVIKRTRRLYPRDFGFDYQGLIKKFSSYLGIDLTNKNPLSGEPHWIIVRINKPNSLGYNPVHKDIYESYDQLGTIPEMINMWIPVCGVTEFSGLPIVPASHLIPEDKIKRVKAGSVINGQKYSVNSILSWDTKVNMKTMYPEKNEMIVFSSHLIHGLASNQNNKTRISLEFRLYRQG